MAIACASRPATPPRLRPELGAMFTRRSSSDFDTDPGGIVSSAQQKRPTSRFGKLPAGAPLIAGSIPHGTEVLLLPKGSDHSAFGSVRLHAELTVAGGSPDDLGSMARLRVTRSPNVNQVDHYWIAGSR